MAEQSSMLQKYDRYISGLFAPEDDALKSARAEMREEQMPEINVSASEGKALQVLACIIKANRILEIGTLGAYSTIWLARALPPDGKLITLEINPRYAAVARRNLKRTQLEHKVEIRVGPALELLSQLETRGEPAFDMVFIDADKESYPKYLQKAVTLVREGGLILADNTLPDAVLDPRADNGIKRFNAAVSAHPELISVLIPVLRTQGIDGLLIAAKQRKSSGQP
jgi:caffeoyl-CoA O-methyltransferase